MERWNVSVVLDCCQQNMMTICCALAEFILVRYCIGQLRGCCEWRLRVVCRVLMVFPDDPDVVGWVMLWRY